MFSFYDNGCLRDDQGRGIETLHQKETLNSLPVLNLVYWNLKWLTGNNEIRFPTEKVVVSYRIQTGKRFQTGKNTENNFSSGLQNSLHKKRLYEVSPINSPEGDHIKNVQPENKGLHILNEHFYWSRNFNKPSACE